MLARYPEHFGALFCTVPLVDMRRYTKLLGASGIDEYGAPEKADDWAFLRESSAYHAASPGQPYPPILLATTTRDDRVHPGHARKMAQSCTLSVTPLILRAQRRRAQLWQGQIASGPHSLPWATISFAARSVGTLTAVQRWEGPHKGNAPISARNNKCDQEEHGCSVNYNHTSWRRNSAVHRF